MAPKKKIPLLSLKEQQRICAELREMRIERNSSRLTQLVEARRVKRVLPMPESVHTIERRAAIEAMLPIKGFLVVVIVVIGVYLLLQLG